MTLGAFWIIVLILVLYFTPATIAYAKGRRNAGAIFVLNLLAGWTFAGWVIAIVWALCKDKEINEFRGSGR